MFGGILGRMKNLEEKSEEIALNDCLVKRGRGKISGGTRVFSPRTHQKVFILKMERKVGGEAQFELTKMPPCTMHVGIVLAFFFLAAFLPFLLFFSFFFWACSFHLLFFFFFFFLLIFFCGFSCNF